MTQAADVMCRVWWLAPSAHPMYAKGNEDICIVRRMYETNTPINTKTIKSHQKGNKKNYKYIKLQSTCPVQY